MSIRDLHAAQSKAMPTDITEADTLVEIAAVRDGHTREHIPWNKHRFGRSKAFITQKPSYIPLLLCLLIAIVVRAFIVIHTQGFIDGDEALVGIQAEHILRGELPIYFYNQPYMGSLEAYIMAGIFAIVGPSVWALRAEPIILSLLVILLTWKLASVLADTAQLPLQAKQWFMTIAVFLAAIPPLYDTVLELRTLGGYIETFILMQLLLLLALQLTNRRAAGSSSRELAWYWAGVGFIVGLGLWVNPLILYAVLAAAIWIIWDWIKALVSARQTFLKTLFLPALASIPACILGLTPAIYWGALNRWQNITYILQLSGNPPLRPSVQAQYPTRLDIFFGLTHLYTTCVGPRILSGALPGENAALTYLHTPTFVLSAFCIVTTVALVAFSFIQPHPLLLAVRRVAALPIVFAASVSVIFCVTETAASGLWSCQYDLAGRYATPLMLVIPFFVATICTVVIMLDTGTYRLNQKITSNEVQLDAARENTKQLHSVSSREAIPTPQANSVATSGSSYWKLALGLLVALLIVSVYLQIALYAASDAGNTFQSSFCTNTPANNDAIIAYMEREHIHYAWANNWVAYPIVFKTHENIIISDPLPLIRHISILDRIPVFTQAVRNADKPSFLVLVKHKDPHPLMLKFLDKQKIRYNVARFPSQPGIDVLVITPLNRTVLPLDSFFFNVFICSRDG